jgi:hypothetical protein
VDAKSQIQENAFSDSSTRRKNRLVLDFRVKSFPFSAFPNTLSHFLVSKWFLNFFCNKMTQ